MKKFLVFVLMFIVVLSVVGCGEVPPPHEHDFNTTLSYDQDYHWYKCKDESCTETLDKKEHNYGVGTFSGTDDDITYQRQCITCNYKDTPEVEILNDVMDADYAFRNLEPGQVFWLKQDNYSHLDLEIGDLVFGFEEGAVIDGIRVTADTSKLEQGISNLEFHNLTFNENGDGFVGDYNILNLSFINCKFSNKAQICSSLYNGVENCHIGNLLLKNCEFKDIHTPNNLRSSVVITACTDLTIDGCVFDGADFNALQIGERFLKGKIQITNNVFKNIGNRYVKLINTAGVTSCDISGNTFYKLELKDDANDKRFGNYFQTIEGNITIGVNTWEEIPPNEKEYFISGNENSPIIYNPNEQLLLNN
ncbi:MAG: hypothetical protein IKA12_04080 [Clostridia bacterium]|nr:hypothetical protein [Clostridia bacterium]